ncbi:keratin-associated protein 19-2-like [Oenanthe melanoleuca]|uniref:keratin-associated protein 19-2-like n=1 Tax=Oenanthe melanoleuca TaxID=2939378 RepID=UPI0024C14698|nr:keratin-associated protein 19-2-like [Oenanthe melanoleuca]
MSAWGAVQGSPVPGLGWRVRYWFPSLGDGYGGYSFYGSGGGYGGYWFPGSGDGYGGYRFCSSGDGYGGYRFCGSGDGYGGYWFRSSGDGYGGYRFCSSGDGYGGTGSPVWVMGTGVTGSRGSDLPCAQGGCQVKRAPAYTALGCSPSVSGCTGAFCFTLPSVSFKL